MWCLNSNLRTWESDVPSYSWNIQTGVCIRYHPQYFYLNMGTYPPSLGCLVSWLPQVGALYSFVFMLHILNEVSNWKSEGYISICTYPDSEIQLNRLCSCFYYVWLVLGGLGLMSALFLSVVELQLHIYGLNQDMAYSVVMLWWIESCPANVTD